MRKINIKNLIYCPNCETYFDTDTIDYFIGKNVNDKVKKEGIIISYSFHRRMCKECLKFSTNLMINFQLRKNVL